MNDDSEATLKRIRELADRAVELRARWLLEMGTLKALKEAADVVEAELRDLCRSHETSEEVAARPLIKACEEREPSLLDVRKETLAALITVGHTYEQAIVRVETAVRSGVKFPDISSMIEWIYGHPPTYFDGEPESHQVVNDHLAAVERDADGECDPEIDLALKRHFDRIDAELAGGPSYQSQLNPDGTDPMTPGMWSDPTVGDDPGEVDNTDGTTPPWPNGEHGLTPELIEQAGAAFSEMFGDPTETPKPKRRQKGADRG